VVLTGGGASFFDGKYRMLSTLLLLSYPRYLTETLVEL